MYYLLKRGVVDLDQWDRPNDTSIQSLQYMAVVGDCLWEMIEGERLRVSRLFGSLLVQTSDGCSTGRLE